MLPGFDAVRPPSRPACTARVRDWPRASARGRARRSRRTSAWARSGSPRSRRRASARDQLGAASTCTGPKGEYFGLTTAPRREAARARGLAAARADVHLPARRPAGEQRFRRLRAAGAHACSSTPRLALLRGPGGPAADGGHRHRPGAGGDAAVAVHHGRLAQGVGRGLRRAWPTASGCTRSDTGLAPTTTTWTRATITRCARTSA